MVYDAAIVGTGPAGISAALNLHIHRKNFVWIGSAKLSDKISKAEKILNYPGFSELSGTELNRAFSEHIHSMDIEIREQMVNSILPYDGHFALMAGSECYEARAVILTTGVAMRATLKNESRFLGKGVSYCATCDGGLYRDKVIAVVCSSARFEHEVKYLSELAAAVHYFPLYPKPDKIAENVVTHAEKITAIAGESHVCAVSFQDGRLDVDGVFILRDSISLSSLLPDLETEAGHIAVDRQMRTNIPGIFAAGDCTGRPYQYAKAVGEGNVAAHSVIGYLAEKK